MVDWVLYKFQIIHFSTLKSWSGSARFENWHYYLAENLKLRVDRPQLSLGLTLSADFTILPGEAGLSARHADVGLQVRHQRQVEAQRGGGSAATLCVTFFGERQCFQLLFCYLWKVNLVSHERIKNYPTTA